MVTVMMVGALEYISGQQWFDGMMVSDHEGVWMMKPPHSQHSNKVLTVMLLLHMVLSLFPIATIWSNHVLHVSTQLTSWLPWKCMLLKSH